MHRATVGAEDRFVALSKGLLAQRTLFAERFTAFFDDNGAGH
jgi:hypothetical protein